jgi:CubicO group peptidase (beta-lactamase class C family)
MRFGVGFMLAMATARVYDQGEFGHSGYGGQAAGAWPERNASFTYFTTALRSGDVADKRVALVLAALDESRGD